LWPASYLTENDGETAELHVQDSVAEGGVEGDEEADWCGEELDGAEEEFVGELFDGNVPFFEFGVEGPGGCVSVRVVEWERVGKSNLPVAGFVAERAGFDYEEFRRVRLVDENNA
jgi:hypothetical protein